MSEGGWLRARRKYLENELVWVEEGQWMDLQIDEETPALVAPQR